MAHEHHSAASLAAVLDTVIDGIVVIDASGVIQAFNAAAEGMFGWRAEEVIGRNVSVLMPEPDHSRHDGYLSRYRETGEARIIGTGREVRGKRRDGSTFPLDLGVSEYADGNERRFVAVLRDITERRATEEALRRERDFANSLIDTAPVIVLVLDIKGRIVRFNPHMERLTGRTLEEVRGKDWFSTFLPEDEQERVSNIFRHATSGTRTHGNVNRILAADGSQPVIEWYDTELTDTDGRPIGLLSIGLDVTARVTATDSLRTTEAALRAKEREFLHAQKMEAVGRLAGGIAHDFNNLLMGINGCVDIALRKIEGNNPARPFLEEVKHSAVTGASITGQLLSFSRKEEAGDVVNDVSTVVAESEPMLRRLLGEDVALRLELDARGVRVRCNAGQMEQLLMNLVINARDAMPDGGVLNLHTVAVDLDAEMLPGHADLTPGPYVRLQVQDNGVGMSAETQARLFEPFFTTKDVGEGTGLGLSTVYGIIRQCGGHVDVESRLGAGTCFTIFLPRTDEPVSEPVTEAPPAGGSETVLIVEDEATVRISIEHYLERAGYRVLASADGEEALATIESHGGDLDLVLVDMVLPGMAGPKLVREIALRCPGARVLSMSAYPRHKLLREGRLDPDAASIAKPFTEVQLLRRVRQVLDGATQSEHGRESPRVGEPASGSRRANGSTLLLVEDHDGSRIATESLLQDLGYGVLAARDSAEALALVREAGEMVDLLLTDLRLPGRSGAELASKLRDIQPDLPVVYISGLSPDDPDVVRALEAPRTRFVPKPMDLDRVAEIIEAVLSRSAP